MANGFNQPRKTEANTVGVMDYFPALASVNKGINDILYNRTIIGGENNGMPVAQYFGNQGLVFNDQTGNFGKPTASNPNGLITDFSKLGSTNPADLQLPYRGNYVTPGAATPSIANTGSISGTPIQDQFKNLQGTYTFDNGQTLANPNYADSIENPTNMDLTMVKPNTALPTVNMDGLGSTDAYTASADLQAQIDAIQIPGANKLTVDQQQRADQQAFQNEMAPWAKAGTGMQIASSGLEALSGLYNAYMAHKTYELSKDSFEYNRSLSNVNLENQAKLVNQDLADRQAIRASTGNYQDVSTYMQDNAVRGRV